MFRGLNAKKDHCIISNIENLVAKIQCQVFIFAQYTITARCSHYNFHICGWYGLYLILSQTTNFRLYQTEKVGR